MERIREIKSAHVERPIITWNGFIVLAVGLALITFMASRYGWRAVYGGIGAIGCLSFLLLMWRLPGGLIGAPVDLKTWAISAATA